MGLRRGGGVYSLGCCYIHSLSQCVERYKGTGGEDHMSHRLMQQKRRNQSWVNCGAACTVLVSHRAP